jgi:hypothetical protein
MTTGVYRFTFDKEIALTDAEATLHLAMIAAEGLFGNAIVRMDVSFEADQAGRSLTVDGTTPVGAAVVRMFTSLMLREFGEDAFTVRRVKASSAEPAAAAA